MSETTPRQVLYALVSGGFLVVAAILTVGTAIADIVPTWWSFLLALVIASASTWVSLNWRRTGVVLLVSMLCFVLWMVGTLVLA